MRWLDQWWVMSLQLVRWQTFVYTTCCGFDWSQMIIWGTCLHLLQRLVSTGTSVVVFKDWISMASKRHNYWRQFVVSVVLNNELSMENIPWRPGSHSDPGPCHHRPYPQPHPNKLSCSSRWRSREVRRSDASRDVHAYPESSESSWTHL